MAYAPPSIGPQGLTIPSYSDILSNLLAQFRNVYGQTVYLGTDSADYQWIAVIALKISDTMRASQMAYNSRSPLTASGAALDALVKLNGLARKVASFSTCALTLTGTPGATITNGVARDVNGYLWVLPTVSVIGGGGTVVLTAVCATSGSVTATPGQINSIATPTAGWTAVTNAAAAATGQPVESDAQLRARQGLSAALPSQTMFAGTQAGIAAVSGVTRYNIIENPTGTVTAGAPTWGTPAHSLTCVVEGGTDTAVATVIYNNRGIGCQTNGTTTVTVTDPYTNGTLGISFSRPTYVPIYVSLSVHPLTGYTTAIQTAIQTAIVTYLNSLQIGELVVLSELYGAALSARSSPLLPIYSIRAMTLGTTASPSGTSDVTFNYNQVAQGITANVVITQV